MGDKSIASVVTLISIHLFKTIPDPNSNFSVGISKGRGVSTPEAFISPYAHMCTYIHICIHTYILRIYLCPCLSPLTMQFMA